MGHGAEPPSTTSSALGSGTTGNGSAELAASSGSSRGRGCRGTMQTRGRGASAQVEKHLGTIHGDLFTRKLDQSKQGVRGNKVQSVANYVRIVSHPDHNLYQYHVSFQPEVDSKQVRENILDSVMAGTSFLFDGAILYVPSGDMSKEITRTGIHPITGNEVIVVLKQTVEFTTNDPQAINVYNLLIRRAMKKCELVPVGRHFFDPRQNKEVGGYGIEIWPGFETAIRLYEDGLMLCIENRWKVLRQETVLQLMLKTMQRAGNSQEAFEAECDRLLTGQTIITGYNNKLYRITSVDHEMSPLSKFMQADGKEITFVDYFQQQYRCIITDMHQPLLVSQGKPKQPGEEPQKTYLVPQLCNMTGITDDMRKNMQCMRAMSNVTRLTPMARYQMTKVLLDKLLRDPECVEIFSSWNFELEPQLVHLTARELESEKLFGGSDRPYVVQKAEWARSVKSSGTCTPCNMSNWIFVVPNSPPAIDLAKKFIAECKNIGRALGMNVGDPLTSTVNSSEAKDYHDVVKQIIETVKDQQIHMVVVMLNDDNKTRYDTLKKLLCLDLPGMKAFTVGVPSQCVLQSTLAGKPHDRGENKNFSSIILKIMLQMNCKMGGAIWKVKVPFKGGMIVGYDLYSDSTTRGKSVGACVSSYDQEFTQWYNQTRPHENPTELGVNLVYFVKRALRKYYDNNNHTLPLRLFLYRDGVGDGQIPYVRDQEVRQVEDACKDVCDRSGLTDHEIKIAFIVVTKKVNMRVFKGTANNVLENPTPGTIIDNVVTRPERYDFYMVPQAVNQGTVTPVCYNILKDDTGFDADKHHMLAFKLCHLYYNWQGTVRVPAPCQYAHKLAFLVAQSLHRDADKLLHDKLYYL